MVAAAKAATAVLPAAGSEAAAKGARAVVPASSRAAGGAEEAKWRAVADALAAGFSVLLADPDTVFLSDPFRALYRDCDVEAAKIEAAAPERNASKHVGKQAADRHCELADDAYPFDCAVPCLEQCDACSSTSQCLPRCFHQCMQGSHCNKVCDKIYTGCDYTCQRLQARPPAARPARALARARTEPPRDRAPLGPQSGEVDNLFALFQV